MQTRVPLPKTQNPTEIFSVTIFISIEDPHDQNFVNVQTREHS